MKITLKLVLILFLCTPSLFAAHVAKIANEMIIGRDFAEKALKFFEDNHKVEGIGETIQYDMPYSITSPILIENHSLYIIFKGNKYEVREAPGYIIEQIHEIHTPVTSHSLMNKGAFYFIKGYINSPNDNNLTSYFNVIFMKKSN
jgi:hypothetical protein